MRYGRADGPFRGRRPMRVTTRAAEANRLLRHAAAKRWRDVRWRLDLARGTGARYAWSHPVEDPAWTRRDGRQRAHVTNAIWLEAAQVLSAEAVDPLPDGWPKIVKGQASTEVGRVPTLLKPTSATHPCA